MSASPASKPTSLANRMIAALWGVCFALSPVSLFAEDLSSQPDVANSRVQAVGEINSNAVYVRSGPGENYYPTMKMDKGQQVTVVGIKFDWLKIQPPKDSFCYVSQAFVEKFGDGTRGKVTNKDALNVRAGSALNDIKAIVLTQLHEGDEVQITGTKDEYYTIKPPAGAYLYVKKDFVNVVKAEPAVADAAGPQQPAKPGQGDAAAKPQPQVSTSGGDIPTGESPAAATPATQPSGENDATNNAATAAAPTSQGSGAEAVAAAPSTQPAAPAPEVVFDKLEGDFLAAGKSPLDQQPAAELLKAYEDLVKRDELPESMRRIADYRVTTLKARVQAQQELAAVRKQQEEAAQRRVAMKAEQDELVARIKATDVKLYAAVGTLRTSSLQGGAGGMLYRLTDPSTGRTLVYVRTPDAKYAGFIGKFIGVRGDISNDSAMNLRVINPTEAEAVDMGQVNQGISATIYPPSLLRKPSPQQSEASTGNQ